MGSVCSRDVSLTLICFPWYLAAILPLDVVHTLGNLFTNMSLEKVYVSFTHTIKAIEPFFSVLLSAMFLEEVSSFSDLCFFFDILDTITLFSIITLISRSDGSCDFLYGRHQVHSFMHSISCEFIIYYNSIFLYPSQMFAVPNNQSQFCRVWMFNKYIQSLLSMHSASTHTSKLRLFSLNDFVQYLLTLSIIVKIWI